MIFGIFLGFFFFFFFAHGGRSFLLCIDLCWWRCSAPQQFMSVFTKRKREKKRKRWGKMGSIISAFAFIRESSIWSEEIIQLHYPSYVFREPCTRADMSSPPVQEISRIGEQFAAVF